MAWNFNINKSPQGKIEKRENIDKNGRVITKEVFVCENCLVATKCGKVIISCVLKSGRWNWLASDELPIAWQPNPPHPNVILDD